MKRIQERLRSFVPRRAKGVQQLAILILGFATLLGVTQAGTLQQMLMGVTESAVSKQVTSISQTTTNATLNTSIADTTAPTGEVESSNAPNIVDLIAESELIVKGMVKEVTDGFENGVPYTQVTLSVDEALRGQVGNEYTFRQFGLTKPRSMGNGKVNLSVTPDGWSNYAVGENSMLFL
jgi:hypothetical protein